MPLPSAEVRKVLPALTDSFCLFLLPCGFDFGSTNLQVGDNKEHPWNHKSTRTDQSCSQQQGEYARLRVTR